MCPRICFVLCLLLSCLHSSKGAAPSVVLSEILADNHGGLLDEDGQSSGWIEIRNASATSVSLAGWALSDAADLNPRWVFPGTNLPAASYLVVFASEKNRTNSGAPLHTFFKLKTGGGHLALVDPSGAVTSEFDYGPQSRDVSFGVGRDPGVQSWIPANAPAVYLTPLDNSLANQWTGANEPFDDSRWSSAILGLGYDLTPRAATDLLAFWDFNNNAAPASAADATGHGHTGAVISPAAYTTDKAGRSGAPGDRAMNMGPTGNGARVTIPDVATGWLDVTKNNDAITFSLWTHGDSTQPGQGSAFWGASGANGSGTRSAQAHVPWSDSVVYWDTAGADPSRSRVSVLVPDPASWRGAWNHYVFLKNKSVKEIWLNGARILSGSSPDPLTQIRSFSIGAIPDGSLSYGGLIDDFAIWSRALTAEEIGTLAQGVSPSDIGRISGLFTTDVSSKMRGVNASIYVRAPFDAPDPKGLDSPLLRVRANGGFVAYLNGVEVARRRAPSNLGFDSAATPGGPAPLSPPWEDFDLGAFASVLRAGRNILAIQGLNNSATDDRFLLNVQLIAGRSLGARYFSAPTPGGPNTRGSEGVVADPVVSAPRGFYSAPFQLTCSTPTPGASLAYTLDGSVPSSTNGVRSASNTITLGVSNTTLLRVVGTKPGSLGSAIATFTYLFPSQIARQGRPTYLGATWPSGAPTDFEMDARVLTNTSPHHSLDDAFQSIPTLSVVAPSEGFFGPIGIYTLPSGGGLSEVPASAELIYPDGRQGFQEDVGIEVHGNITRDKSFTPKHSFNLKFRAAYGNGKLRFPLFEDSPVDGFDHLVLRAGSTDTWPVVNWDTFLVDGVQRWVRDEASYVRDQWVRDAQIAMGEVSSHGTYVHLFLSGYYWGLYNMCEHTDDAFAASYYGGAKEDYDVLADFAEVHAGTKTAWDQMNAAAGAGLASDASYFKIQGMNPDGTRNPSYPVLLDVTNLVDYMILHIYIGADDWPNHNWWASRKRTADSAGFRFFAWDQEISINSLIRQQSSWGSVYAEADVPETPTFAYARCRANVEFRTLFADRVQKHLFNNGALSFSNNLARWDRRMSEVDRAVVAESARWGDYQRPLKPYTREVEWLASNAWMRAVFYPSNQVIAMKRFTDARLYPTVGAPRLTPFGGEVKPGATVALSHTNAAGTLLFTLDGSDPRLRGGAISPKATLYSTPIPITRRTTISARTRQGTNWSALVFAEYHPTQNLSVLELTEIMYHPAATPGQDPDAFEFIELHNAGPTALDLAGLRFTSGMTFAFTNGSQLAADAYLVLVRDPAAFASRYPGVTASGQYTGKLSDHGEAITLGTADGNTIWSYDYAPGSLWPLSADGGGFSLVRADGVAPNPQEPSSAWRASSQPGGSPGKPDQPEARPQVVVSELLSSGVAAGGDFIELQNLSPAPAAIGGWFLSDNPATPKKYRIPDGTTVPSGGFLVVSDSEYGPARPAPGGVPFGLDALGDSVHLFSADTAGNLTGYSHGLSFKASEPGVSWIRVINSVGGELLLRSQVPTPGSSNAPPWIGPVVISEIHYHPLDGDPEFVELLNITDSPVPLFDPARPTNTWALKGINYLMPANLTLAPGQRLVICDTNPAAFRQGMGLGPAALVLGPFAGALQDSGERLELLKPIDQTTNGIAYEIIDSVRYNDKAPWSPAADGNGPSLQRLGADEIGDDPMNWASATPSPDAPISSGLPPRILQQPQNLTAAERSAVQLEALVDGTRPFEFQWRKDGSAIPDATNSVLKFPSLSKEDAGDYRVSVSNGSGAALSDNAVVRALPLPFIYAPPVSRAVISNTVVTLNVLADGTGPLRYQWFQNGFALANGVAASLKIPAFGRADEGLYSVRVTDDVGSTTTDPVKLEILFRPALLSFPSETIAVEGDDVFLFARGAGTRPLTFLWRRGAVLLLTDISTSGSSTLLLRNVKTNQTGNYTVSINNVSGMNIASPAFAIRVLADSDGDHMPNEWELANGLNPKNPADASSDIDGDGYTALQEYWTGSDPRNASSPLRWESTQAISNQIALGFTAVSNRSYSVFARDRVDGIWTKLTDIQARPATQTQTVLDALPITGARYYKLTTPAQP